MNSARLTSKKIQHKDNKSLSLSLQNLLNNVKLRRSLIPSRWASQLLRMLRSPLTRQLPLIMSVFLLVPAMSKWTRSSRNFVRSSDLSPVAVVLLLLVLPVFLVFPVLLLHLVLLCFQVVYQLLLQVMLAQRLQLLRLLLPKNVQRLMLKSPNRNVLLLKRSRELQRLHRTASMPRRRRPRKRARRPTQKSKKLSQIRMQPMLRRSKRLLMPS